MSMLRAKDGEPAASGNPDDGDWTVAGPALAEWCELSEALLRGLVHSLNNRITALSAAGELAAMGDSDFASGEVLPTELARLQQVNGLFRLLVSESPLASAMETGPVVDDAVALHAHHTRLRTVHCDVVRTDGAIPVRAPRWALLRLLLVLVEEGKRAAERTNGERIVLRLAGDEHWLVLQVDGATVTPYAAAMARLCGGDPSPGDTVVRIPTLLELRRLERLMRDATAVR